MSKARNTGNLNNSIQISDTGNITFVSGSTTLLAISSSGAVTTTGVISGSNALSASFAATASFVTLSQTASFVTTAQTASFVANAVNAATASSADNFLTRGTLTAQTIVVQTITSSQDFVTGSTRFGSNIALNTHQFTGSVSVTGSLAVVTNGTEFQVGNTGVNLGNALTDSHIISGSLTVNPGGGLFVSSSGLVGIGTTIPGSPLEVYSSNVFNTSTGANPHLNINYNSGTAGGPAIKFSRVGVSDWSGIQADLSGGTRTLKFIQTNGGVASTQMVINANDGAVGIGPTSPTARLHVSSSAAASTIFRVDTAASNGTLFVSSSGWVGIGTTNPTNKFHISDSTSNYITVDRTSNNYRLLLGAETAGTAIYSRDAITPSTGVDLRFVVGTSEAMRISGSNGYIGIGTTTPTFLLDLQRSSAGADVGLRIQNTAASGINDASVLHLGWSSLLTGYSSIITDRGGRAGTTLAQGSLYFNANQDATERIRMTIRGDSGHVGIGTTAPLTRLDTRASSSYATNTLLQSAFFGTNDASGPLGIVIQHISGSGNPLRTEITSTRYGVSGNDLTLNRDSGTGAGGMTIQYQGNVGINTSSPAARLHSRGSAIIESTEGRFYGEAKSFSFQSVFNNPTINLITINNTSSYGAIMIRVTVYQNTVSTSRSNIHVGYANWAADPYPTVNKGIIAPTVIAQFNGCTNVGTLAWSGNTLQYTSNRHTNYDGYTIVVEWGANTDNNLAPTYGGNLQ